jgi:hypothetical protein
MMPSRPAAATIALSHELQGLGGPKRTVSRLEGKRVGRARGAPERRLMPIVQRDGSGRSGAALWWVTPST